MKFSISFAILALPLLVAASPLVERTECNSGSLQCCNTAQSSTSTEVAQLFGLLGIPTQNVGSGLVGMGCTPITVIGLGSSGCKQQTVCCTGNSFSGLVNLGCSPISLGL